MKPLIIVSLSAVTCFGAITDRTPPSTPASSQPTSTQASDEILVSVLGQPIRVHQIELTPSDRKMCDTRDEPTDKCLERLQQEHLRLLVLRPLIDRYIHDHRLEPTETEVAELDRYMQQSTTAHLTKWRNEQAELSQKLQSRPADAPDRPALEKRLQMLSSFLDPKHQPDDATRHQVGKQVVRIWKFHKALHQQYGGRVIFQQAGLEPVGAYVHWLNELENNGELIFHSSWAKQQVMAVFELPGHDDTRPHPFEHPWWSTATAKTATQPSQR